MGESLASWEEGAYVSEWLAEDVLSGVLELPRRISAALVEDAGVVVSHVVDLGAGSGPYLSTFLRTFVSARGTWVDASEAMREAATDELESFADRVDYVVGDVEQLETLPLAAADVVLTSRVLHHFSPTSLQRTYRAGARLLRPGGFFFNLDHVGAPGDWEQRYRRIRGAFTGRRKTPIRPHRHEFPLAPVSDHLAWLAAAGLEHPDVPWRMLYTALMVARKPV